MVASDVQTRLVCFECSIEAEADARGLRGFLTVDDEVAIYCPK